VFVCSTGHGTVYPCTVVTAFNVKSGDLQGFIIADLGAFDHFAMLGLPSQIEASHHPLLVHVLVVERSLEVLLSDLEYTNVHTVVKNVTLNQRYADKVAEYRVWWAGWQNRLSVLQRTTTFLLSQLEDIELWLPPESVKEYNVTSKHIAARLGRVVESSKSASVFGKTIANRLAAWQDAVSGLSHLCFIFTNHKQAFRKAAQTDSNIMQCISELTRKDGSTMKLLAFLVTVFLPATFVTVSS